MASAKKNKQVPKAIQKPQPAAPAKTPWIWALALIIVSFLLYANSIKHDYALDDAGAITGNQFVQQGLKGIPSILTVDLWHFDNVNLGYYRPLSLITFAIEYQYFKNAPHVNHFGNVVLYAISIFILFLLLLQIFRNQPAGFSFLIALLFAAHPVHTEVVANIKSRDEILSFLNLAATLFFLMKYIRTNKLYHFLLSLPFFYLSLLSKETSIVGLFLAPVLIYFTTGPNWKKIIAATAVFGVVAVLFLIQKKIMLGSLSGSVPEDLINYPYVSNGNRIATACVIFIHLLKIVLFPIILKYDYSYNSIPAANWSDLMAIPGLLLILAMGIYALMKIKKKDPLSVSLFIFLITLAPALGFIVLRGGILAERFLYAPSLGFCIAVVACGSYLLKKAPSPATEKMIPWFRQNSMLTIGVMIIFSLYSFKTIDRNKAWSDNFTLFTTDIVNNPNSAQNHRHVGSEYINKATAEKDSVKKKELFDIGVSELKTALRIHPKFGDGYFKLGVAYHAVYLNYDSAKYYYLKAIEMAPGYAISYNNLGILYQSVKKYDLASYYYNKAVEMNPNFPDGKVNAAALKAATGLDVHLYPIDMNVDSLAKSTAVKNDKYFFDLGTFYASKGDYSTALTNFQQALNINPSNEDVAINMANCYGITGQYKQSVHYNQYVLQLNPSNLRALQNLSITYQRMGDKSNEEATNGRIHKLTGK